MDDVKSKWVPLQGDETDEARVRAALGRMGMEPRRWEPAPQSSPHRARRHFVKDGDVPVEIRSTADGGTNRLAAALTEIAVEKEVRLRAEDALRAAQHTIEEMKTRLAHQEMTLREAQQARQEAEAALEGKGRAPAAKPSRATPLPVPEPAPKRPRGRPRKHPLSAPVVEQQPVEWWIPGWKKGYGLP